MNQLLIIGAAAIAIVAAYNINNAAVRTVAVQNERASVEKQAEKKDVKAQANRRAAAASDAVRLLDQRREFRD